MKNHKTHTIDIGDPSDYSVESLIALLEEAERDIVNPLIENNGWDYPDFRIVGWRPMTDEEIRQAKNQRSLARKADKERKQKEEDARRELYERLKEEFDAEKD